MPDQPPPDVPGADGLRPGETLDEREAEEAATAQLGLLRNSAVMAGGSVLSRITGVLRNTALAAALGLTISADAFALGNSLPSIIYALVVGGALNAIFVPQIVRRMRDDADAGQGYTDSLISVTSVVLVVLTVVSVLAAPLIVGVYATGGYTQQQVDLAIAFARYCLPQILFFGLYTMLSQVLNARGHFAMPMFAPIMNNLVAIVTYVSFVLVVGTGEQGLSGPATAWLGIGTTLGIVAQALVLVPVLRRTGYSWHFSRRWRGMGLRKAGRLAAWTLGLVGVTQLAFVVIARLATQANVDAAAAGATPAGLATYTNAFLVFMIPHGIVTVSIVTAQLPGLSRMAHAGQMRAAGADIGHTMRLVATVIAPLAAGLLVGAQALTALLFEYGAASAAQASELGTVISIFMLGLLPFTLYYVLQRGWYALEDTRTPFLFAVLMNGVLVATAVPLFAIAAPGGPQVNALAAAYALGSLVTFVVAWPVLRRAYGYLDSATTLVALVKVAVAAGVAVGGTLALRLVLPTTYQLGQSKLAALVDLTVSSLLVLALFVGVARVLRVAEVGELTRWIGHAFRRVSSR